MGWRDALTIEELLNQLTNEILDTRTRAMVEAWTRAWDQTQAELDSILTEITATTGAGGTVPVSTLTRHRRLQAAITALHQTLQALAGQALTGIQADITDIIDAADEAHTAMITAQLPAAAATTQAGITVMRADPTQIKAILARSVETITRDMDTMPDQVAATIRHELVRAITVGENPRVTARRMVRRVEDRFNFGLTRAMVISRTETLDAQRTAAKATQDANLDVLAGWVWQAHIDDRTCRGCVAMHGSLHDLDEPGPIDHHQGRCARVPKTKTWRELGFDIDEPESLITDGEHAFERLSEGTQRAILGKDYDAWKKGDYPVSDWVRTRKNDGWRDSIAPTKAPKS